MDKSKAHKAQNILVAIAQVSEHNNKVSCDACSYPESGFNSVPIPFGNFCIAVPCGRFTLVKHLAVTGGN